MTFVDDGAFIARGIGSYQKPCNRFDRPLGRGKADPLQRGLGELLQAFQRQRQMRSAPCADDRVDFVDDDCSDGASGATARSAVSSRYKDSGGDEDMRRSSENGGALGLRCIARGIDRRGDEQLDALRFGELTNAATRLREILVDVRAECLQR